MSKQQTAVEWLANELVKKGFPIEKYGMDLYEQAKAMEKEQIELTAIKCHFEGVRQQAKTSEEYIEYGKQYYKETYG